MSRAGVSVISTLKRPVFLRMASSFGVVDSQSGLFSPLRIKMLIGRGPALSRLGWAPCKEAWKESVPEARPKIDPSRKKTIFAGGTVLALMSALHPSRVNITRLPGLFNFGNPVIYPACDF